MKFILASLLLVPLLACDYQSESGGPSTKPDTAKPDEQKPETPKTDAPKPDLPKADEPVPPKEVRDPVCNMAVDAASKFKSTYQERTYTFCSQKCKDEFDENPTKFVKVP